MEMSLVKVQVVQHMYRLHRVRIYDTSAIVPALVDFLSFGSGVHIMMRDIEVMELDRFTSR